MILLPIFPNNILFKNNFDIILLGFGYLNVYNNNTIDTNYFYQDIQEYLKNNIFLNEEYINDVKNFFH